MMIDAEFMRRLPLVDGSFSSYHIPVNKEARIASSTHR